MNSQCIFVVVNVVVKSLSSLGISWGIKHVVKEYITQIGEHEIRNIFIDFS